VVLWRVVDLIKASAPGGDLSSTLEVIENSLRADQAKLTRRNESGPPEDLSRPQTAPAGRFKSPAGRGRPESTARCLRGFH
jgi:hypothetical protein